MKPQHTSPTLDTLSSTNSGCTWFIDADSCLHSFNQQFVEFMESVLGITPKIGTRLVPEKDPAGRFATQDLALLHHIAKASATAIEHQEPRQEHISVLIKHSLFHYVLTLLPVVEQTTEQMCVMGVAGHLLDITASFAHQSALEQQQYQWQRLLQEMPVMLNALNDDLVFVFWNAECERVTGYTAQEILYNARAFQMLYPNEGYLEQKLHQWRESKGVYREMEWKLTTKAGVERTTLWSNISKYVPISGWAEWAVGIDITERVQAVKELHEVLDEQQQWLKALAEEKQDTVQAFIAGQEYTFGMAGQRLHDSIGGHISTLKLHLEMLYALLKESLLTDQEQKQIYQHLETTLTMSTSIINDVRQLSHTLAPQVAITGNVRQALYDLFEDIGQNYQLQTTLFLDDMEFLSNFEQKLLIYRTVQELVSNTLQYAQATAISFQIVRRENSLYCMYEDNGEGFSSQSVIWHTGMRMVIHRLAMMNVFFSIDAQEGHGMSATFVLSLQ
jgi:PAS domain S-box-containing protein